MKRLILFIVVGLLVSCSVNKQLEEKVKQQDKKIIELEMSVSDNQLRIDRLSKKKEVKSSPNEKAMMKKIELLSEELKSQRKKIKELEEKPTLKKNKVTINKRAPKVKPKGAPLKKYEHARYLYTSSQFGKSLKVFKDFVKDFPKHALVANAQYWIGECYYAIDLYLKAIEEFQKVIDYYPSSSKGPDAQLKIGMCYEELGQSEQARIELNRIKRMYPKYERQSVVEKILKRL